MNHVRKLWNNSEPAVAGWMQTSSALQAETLASCGYDAIVLDLQHSVTDFAATISMLAAIESKGAEPFVRVQWNDPGDIMRLLDAGAYGIIAPMIETRAQAQALANAMHYPPMGQRSFGPRRPVLRYGPDYVARASDTIVSLAMIETRRGLDNLADILSVEGLDGVFIGPADLAMSLGSMPVPESDDPMVIEAINDILAMAKAADKRVGIFCGSGEAARARISAGFDFVSTTPDLVMLATAARRSVAVARGQEVND
ncbi:aldolase/citrate lyase family protein [Sulfitobacter sp. F26204]|uniref:HpcH/HpaI aldolase family protein n=1 Tax=Sulfitobacter sp. F26204 TaxID=2996014 RepID=UPI00225DE08D|nr:aldolase/citrate lyase family protein [Sulfitobacter sp. F26204]MCX7561460.1 aldolase/citrate lyase family protein [Sulfitobacter sp. F26204]